MERSATPLWRRPHSTLPTWRLTRNSSDLHSQGAEFEVPPSISEYFKNLRISGCWRRSIIFQPCPAGDISDPGSRGGFVKMVPNHFNLSCRSSKRFWHPPVPIRERNRKGQFGFCANSATTSR